jgi:hypothetical protein
MDKAPKGTKPEQNQNKTRTKPEQNQNKTRTKPAAQNSAKPGA